MKKTLIAMSGGVDSAVAALMIKNMGHECLGGIMHLHDCGETESSIADAGKIADRLGFALEVFDFREDFKEKVIGNFIKSYENGATPNPCIDCNRYFKFAGLLLECDRLGFDFLATGHYAQIEYSEQRGRYLLKRAADPQKDQSYVLYSLTQPQLSRVIFPLGGYSKPEIRALAEENGFVNANKKDSQDICFVPDGDYVKVIKERTDKNYPEGDFVTTDGRVLGRHKGIIGYTIGQRRGLGLALPAPMYVCGKDTENNRVILCSNEELFKGEINVCDMNYIMFDSPVEPFRAAVKIRYNQQATPATVIPTGENSAKIVFDTPQRAPAKGQAAVMYDGDYVIGGGTIS